MNIKIRKRLFNIFSTYAIIFISEFTIAMLAPIITLLFYDKSSSLFNSNSPITTRSLMYGLTMMTTQIAMLFSNIVLSSMSDFWGRKKAIIIIFIGILFQCVGCLFAVKSGSLILFIIFMSISYLTYATKPVMTASIIDLTNDKNRLIFVSTIQTFIGLAYTLGPILSTHTMSIKLTNTPFSTPYIIASAIIMITLLFITFFYYNPPILEKRKIKINLSDELLSSIKSKTILTLIIILLLNQLAWGMFFQFAPVIAKTILQFTSNKIGYIFTFIGLALILSSLVLIPIMQLYLSKRCIFNIGIFIFLCGILLATIVSSLTINKNHEILFWISIILTVFGDVTIFTILVTLFTQYFNRKFHGFILGSIYTIGFGVAWASSAILGGITTSIKTNGTMYVCLGLSITLVYIQGRFSKILFKPE